jgi:transketolase
MEASRLFKLKHLSNDARICALEAVHEANSGHIGGSFSAIEILTALYFEVLNVKPENPSWEQRDRVVISKGHCSPAVYSILSLKGYFEKEQLMREYRKTNGKFSGHVEMHVPGIDMSTGSLGQGLSAAVGMALSARIKKERWRAFALMGDGELQEGQNWEAFMAASKLKLNNLIAIIDYNGVQLDGRVEEINSLEPIDDKLRAFGWNVVQVNGHDIAELVSAFEGAGHGGDKPTTIIARTIKGKGVSFMEGRHEWHGCPPNDEQFRIAMEELHISEAEV